MAKTVVGLTLPVESGKNEKYSRKEVNK